jgi:hypothetical protein
LYVLIVLLLLPRLLVQFTLAVPPHQGSGCERAAL